jgi:hypothetical protein
MGANREYKDSVFTKLFSEPERLRELYNAIEGSSYGIGAKIEINTLEDVLFLEQLNDISFIIDDKLVVLVEHQSSVNANMPLRFLMYIARVYEKLVDDRAVYKQRLLKIPSPEFIVLYNGKDDLPEQDTLRLSSAFMEEAAAQSLELTVRVLNINQGYNEGIVKKSETLNGYVAFISKVRENQGNGVGLTDAVTKAIKYCMENHILQGFLTQHASEVLNMLTTEFKLEDAQEVWREEGLEEGLERGLEKGREEGREEGLEKGLEKGREEGLEKGLKKGSEKVLALLRQGHSIEKIEEALKKENKKS